MRGGLLVVALHLVACDEESVPVLPVAGWALAADDLDPFPEHRPADARCPVSAWGPEDGALEVQTGACTYAALEQPLEASFRRGDHLVGHVWFEALDAAEPAEAHVVVSLEGDVLYEAFVPIPSEAAVLPLDVRLERAVEAGERAHLHLHNHGWNSWRLGTLTRVR